MHPCTDADEVVKCCLTLLQRQRRKTFSSEVLLSGTWKRSFTRKQLVCLIGRICGWCLELVSEPASYSWRRTSRSLNTSFLRYEICDVVSGVHHLPTYMPACASVGGSLYVQSFCPRAPFGLRGCKNRPAPFPGWMS